MYIFLDESGDLGFNFDNKNSSNFFCITLLVCYNRNTLFSFKSAIKRTLLSKFNQKNTKKITSELKGASTTISVKKYFYKQLSKYPDQDWEVYSIIVDKLALFKQINEFLEPHRLYNLLSREIIERVDFSILNDHVQLIVDKCKGKRERAIFDYFLKTNLESKLPINVSLNIVHELSHNNAGLQAVDLFCHGIVRKHAQSDISWYSEFSGKIIEEVRWKPKFK
jgi:6-pyruvoyl-tetrahydropterin synthase